MAAFYILPVVVLTENRAVPPTVPVGPQADGGGKGPSPDEAERP